MEGNFRPLVFLSSRSSDDAQKALGVNVGIVGDNPLVRIRPLLQAPDRSHPVSVDDQNV